ncbi:MAG: hypothetical protein HKN44_12115 [Ilumatobacter sp.]|nr:hypothetical protein [Ilumatobacter sp.]
MDRRAVISMIAVMASACSAPADVLVTRADGTAPRDTLATIPPTVPITIDPNAPNATTAPPMLTPASTTIVTTPGERPIDLVPAGTVDALLLAAGDVPEWTHHGPSRVAEEPTFVAENCDAMNVAWNAAASAGTRSRGSVGATAFRNTAVVMPDAAAATAVLDAVRQVPHDCPVIVETIATEWWTEPFTMPPGTTPHAGLVVGSEWGPTTALGFWQVGSTVVVLEIGGDDMWQHVKPLFATMSAKIDGAGGIDVRPPVTEPHDKPATTDRRPATTVPIPPVTLEPDWPDTLPTSDVFPPPYEDWSEHTLARLAPHPSDLGPGWAYRSGSVRFAEPADPTEMIDGCDVSTPATPAGIALRYRLRTDDRDEAVEIELGAGPGAEIGGLMDAYRGLAECDLSADEYVIGLTLVDDVEVAGATDTVVMTGAVGFGGVDEVFAITAVAFDDLVIFVYRSAETDSLADVIDETVAIAELVAARR